MKKSTNTAIIIAILIPVILLIINTVIITSTPCQVGVLKAGTFRELSPKWTPHKSHGFGKIQAANGRTTSKGGGNT